MSADEVKKSGVLPWLKKQFTRSLLLDSALAAYEKSDNKEAIIDAAVRAGALAALNPGKAKEIKNRIFGAIDSLGSNKQEHSTVADRMEALDQLFDKQLITEQEYEEKRAEILSQL